MTASSPFAFLDAVSFTKVDLFSEGAEEKDYNPFLVNRGLSYHIDTVLYAAEVNTLGHLPNVMQFDYHLHSLSSRKRYAKWSKKEADAREREEIISVALNISGKKASEISDMFTYEQITAMKEKQNK